MFARTFAIAMNTYREAVRARVLVGLLALAVGTSAYSLVIATMSLRQEMRIVADIGSSSISIFAVLVSVILGATSLYRELELKTIFPILTRQLRRHEYVLGKYFGILATVLCFVAIDAAAVLTILAFQSKQNVARTTQVTAASLVALAVALVAAKRTRVFVVLPWSIAWFAAMAWVSGGAGDERWLVINSACLTLAEVAIVCAIAMVFSSFSSPFLTAIFTFFLFVIGRSSDSLANIPQRMFGQAVRTAGSLLAKVIPNLNLYVPPRPLLLGQVAEISTRGYLARACLNAVLYAAILLTLSSLIFRRRDFQ